MKREDSVDLDKKKKRRENISPRLFGRKPRVLTAHSNDHFAKKRKTKG